MKKRRTGYAAWVLLAIFLYFFENGTGTRTVLLCSVLLPLIPPLRRAFFSPDDPDGNPAPGPLTVRTFTRTDSDEPGEVRLYMPGDPVRRIHWKLSAKRGELLVRDTAAEKESTETEKESVRPEAGRKRKPLQPAAVFAAAGSKLRLKSSHASR